MAKIGRNMNRMARMTSVPTASIMILNWQVLFIIWNLKVSKDGKLIYKYDSIITLQY